MHLSVKMPLVIRTTRFIIAWGKGDYKINSYKNQNKRTNSKVDLSSHLFGQFVNCIQHIVIV